MSFSACATAEATRPQRNDSAVVPVGMNGIGKEDYIRVRDGINPNRVPVKPVCPNEPKEKTRHDWSQTANQCPSQSRAERPRSEAVAGKSFSRCSSARARAIPSAFLRKYDRSSAVENSPACPATPPMRLAVGSCTGRQHLWFIPFRGRDARAPFRRRQKARFLHSQRHEDIF